MPREKSPQTLLLEDVKNRFAFHPANEKTGPQHDAVRRDLGRVAKGLAQLLPDGREKSLALTKMEEAMFWANAAIARQSVESSDDPAPPAKKTAAARKPQKAVPPIENGESGSVPVKSTRRVARRSKS